MGVISEIQQDLEAGARRFFNEYHSQLLVEARSLCSDSDSAEDLVMITLETYFAKPEMFDPSKGELIAWLKAVMRNHFRKSLRRKSHIDTIFLPADDLQVVAERLQAEEGWQGVGGTEADEMIRRAVASLSPKVRDAVIMHYFKGASVEKTASALGISVEAAKNRLFCARQILHRRLKGRLGKALAVLGAILFGVSALFGAYQAGLVDAVKRVAWGEGGAGETRQEDAASRGEGVSSAQNDAASPGAAVVSSAQDQEPVSNDQQEITTPSRQVAIQEKPTMKLTKTFAAAALAVTAAVITVEADGVTLQLDQAKQRYPWNGLVDIDYTVTLGQGERFGEDDAIEVLLVNKDVSPAVTNKANLFLPFESPLTAGRHRLTWDANADGVTNRIAKAEFLLDIVHYAVSYMVIDVSGGPTAETYPVDFVNGAPADNFNADEYKGDKIVLRRIHPGSYTAGSPADEANRKSYYWDHTERETQHRVAITKPFYIGIFEITQQQWLNVMGEPNPAKYTGMHRPVEKVKYTLIRGGNWPKAAEPGADTFMDRLLKKCKSKDADGNYTIPVKGFDLPTEHQWEYACRAGTTKAINLTDNFDNTQSASQIAQLELAGRYEGNQSKGAGGYSANHTKVGSYQANAWGLYDMLGNVLEWCRDLYQIDPATLSQQVDPPGPDVSQDSHGRVMGVSRGGSWGNAVNCCRSAVRNEILQDSENEYHGFRLSRTLP